jgi:hypothetical protein
VSGIEGAAVLTFFGRAFRGEGGCEGKRSLPCQTSVCHRNGVREMRKDGRAAGLRLVFYGHFEATAAEVEKARALTF